MAARDGGSSARPGQRKTCLDLGVGDVHIPSAATSKKAKAMASLKRKNKVPVRPAQRPVVAKPKAARMAGTGRGLRMAIHYPDGTKTLIRHMNELDPSVTLMRISGGKWMPFDGIEIDQATALSDATGKPVWIQVAKPGSFFKGDHFELNERVFSEIVANFNATTNHEIPVDFEHATEREASEGSIPSEGAPAQGWIKELRVQNGNLYGLVEWGDLAREYIREKKYRYISPAIVLQARDRNTGKPIGARLTSVALTNKPFLDGMMPVAAKDQQMASAQSNMSNADLANLLQAALSEDRRYKQKKETDPRVWVRDVFPDGNVVFEFGSRLFRASFEIEDGKAKVGEAEAVRTQYVTMSDRALCYSANEYMPRIKAALRVHDLTTPNELSEHLGRLREHLEEADGDGTAEVNGVALGSYLQPLRELANVAADASWHDVLEIIENLVKWGYGEHVEENDGDPTAEMSDNKSETQVMKTTNELSVQLTEAQATVVTLTAQLDTAKADNAKLALQLKEAASQVEAAKGQVEEAKGQIVKLTEQSASLQKQLDEQAAKSLDEKVNNAFLAYKDAKKLCDKNRIEMRLLLTHDPKTFDELYPPVAPAQAHLLRTLTTGGDAGRGAEPPRQVTQDTEAKTLSLDDLAKMIMREQGCDYGTALLQADAKVQAAKK